MKFLLWAVVALGAICTGLMMTGVLVAGIRRGHFRGVSLSEATKLEVLLVPWGVVTFLVDALALIAGVLLVFVVG